MNYNYNYNKDENNDYINTNPISNMKKTNYNKFDKLNDIDVKSSKKNGNGQYYFDYGNSVDIEYNTNTKDSSCYNKIRKRIHRNKYMCERLFNKILQMQKGFSKFHTFNVLSIEKVAKILSSVLENTAVVIGLECPDTLTLSSHWHLSFEISYIFIIFSSAKRKIFSNLG